MKKTESPLVDVHIVLLVLPEDRGNYYRAYHRRLTDAELCRHLEATWDAERIIMGLINRPLSTLKKLNLLGEKNLGNPGAATKTPKI